MARLQSPLQKMTVLLLLLAILIFTFAASVSLGSYRISLYDVCQSFLNFNSSSTEHILVMNTRFPRAVVAATVGACLAVAGALTQALTKNPLAAPSVLGINSGAVFFAVVAASLPNILPPVSIVWATFGGAAISSAAVYFLGSIGRDGLTPIKIILAGSAITALFTSFTQGLLVLSESGMKNTLSWLAVMGASLLLLADISARFIIMPSEAPVGVMTAVIGAPFYIYIARRSLRGEK